MEMRARQDISISQDLLPPIPPVVVSIHDPFLKSHCSSCFKALLSISPANPISCPNCDFVSYCSLSCFDSDYNLHSSCSECILLSQSPTSMHPSSTSLRAALRLLTLGLPVSENRVGFLSIGSDPGSEIQEGANLMRKVRKREGEEKEERALGAILTNAVEVLDREGRAVGIAVYGLWFSWFNHSCSPNASYRFEIGLENLERWESGSGTVRVAPESNEDEGHELWKTWVYGEYKRTQVSCRYGPRIVVRSIKTIKKGDEVCIAYTDLLQPKAMRHFDLWSKYHFICCCERCSASPEMYVDYTLNSGARSLAANHSNVREATYDDLSDLFDQTISEYMSNGNPETCRKKLENMLSESFEDSASQEPSKIPFRLHPLHYLALNAYIALSSAYKMMLTDLLAASSNEDVKFKARKMGRASAAYSMLLAGATHHLFMSEPSLIASAAIFWVSAGESLMSFLRCCFEAELSLISRRCRFKFVGCKEMSERFFECISKKLTKSWPYLVEGLSYLENVRSPVDFRWLGIANLCEIEGGRITSNFCLCCECSIVTETGLEEHRSLAELAVCCLSYGRYLAVMCGGEHSYVVVKVNNLFSSIR